jgi:hypothetical protein
MDLFTGRRGVPGCAVEPARRRAVVQFGRGRAVTTLDLHVADQMMNLIGGPEADNSKAYRV